MTLDQKLFKRSEHADATLAGDRAAIYHRVTRNAITLNPTGTVLWEAMAEPRQIIELVEALQQQWPDLDTATARHDVETFLHQLELHELVDERDAPDN